MKKIMYILAIVPLMFISCNNFLDMVPEDDIESLDTIFERSIKAKDWFKKCYTYLNQILPDYYKNPSHLATDEFVIGEYQRTARMYSGLELAIGKQNSFNPIGELWSGDTFWEAIRYINIFLERVDGVHDMLDSDKSMMKGEIKVLKAHIYFELLRRYGPFIIVNENFDITASDKDMQIPRNTFNECVAEIVRLIDDAMPDLVPLAVKSGERKAYHSLEAGLMIKAKTLFLAASPLFNGNPEYISFKNMKGVNLFDATYDAEKWKIAIDATEKAIEIAERGGMSLVRNIKAKTTPFLSRMYDIERSVLAPGYVNSEAIYMTRPADQAAQQGSITRLILPRVALLPGELNHELYDETNMGVLSPSMKMVEMYYTNNGVPLNQDNDWTEGYGSRYLMGSLTKPDTYRNVIPLGKKVLNLHLDREPRFYAHIATDRTYWQRGINASENILVEAYRGERFGTIFDQITNSKAQNISGYWIKKFLNSEIKTQGYMGLAGATEHGYMHMRLAELYLMLSEARNEYLTAPDETVYAPLNIIRERAGIPDVVTSWENYTNSPNFVRNKGTMRDIIRQEWNIEFAFESQRFWNLRRWKTAAAELNTELYGWNVLGKDERSFYNNYKGPVIVWTKNKSGFRANRDDLFPIRGEDIYNSGVTQNPNW